MVKKLVGWEQTPSEESDYAIVYRTYEKECFASGGMIDPLFADSRREGDTGLTAGELVRLQCESGENEVKRYPDGTLVLNHNFPSTEGMSLRERIRNRLGKVSLGFLGEIHTTTYTPIPSEDISAEELTELQEVNSAFRDFRVRIIEE